MATRRLTMAQALILYLSNQHVERDGRESPFFAGVWGIFGHGNVAGIGQALQQYADRLRYYQCRNEQAAVHAAVAYAKQKNRMQTFACTSSIGPGATNMVTGAAVATVNRIPVLLLPGDIFAERQQAPVLQQLESEHTQDIGVNDCFKPVSRYWDRIYRPEQLLTALPEAMRVLTSPADTGAVTLALPQDVQAQAYDYPEELFAKRVWHIARNRPDVGLVRKAAEWIRGEPRPADRGRRRRALQRGARGAARASSSARASRWARPRRARVRSPLTIPRTSERSARPGRGGPTSWRATPTS